MIAESAPIGGQNCNIFDWSAPLSVIGRMGEPGDQQVSRIASIG
jgi:hypothetical protein